MDPKGELTILDYWRVIRGAGWWILVLTAVAALVAFGVARGQPKVYVAKATVLSPRETVPESFGTSLGAMFLGGGGRGGREGGLDLSVPGISLAVPSLSTNEDRVMVLLRSRTMKEEVLAEFAKSWGASVGSKVVSIVPDTKERGVIGLTVQALDPRLAAELANYYFTHLGRMLERYADQATRRRENFYVAQLERAAKEVEAAEAAVLKFQAENRFLALDAPTKREVESVAMVRATIMAYELQLETLRLRFTDQHPQIVELKKQIAELKQQYSKSLFGGAMDLPPESATVRGTRKEFFVPAAKMTPVQFSFLRLYRNLKIQEAFYTAALQGLQQIKYGEGGTPLTVEVLDPAVPPSDPVPSKILYRVAAAAVSALIMGVLLAFVLEHLARVRERDRQSRPRAPGRRRPVDDRPGFPKVPEAERARIVEPEGVPAGRTRSVLAGREE